MTSRERTLAGAIGVILGAGALWYAFDTYQKAITLREDALRKVQRDVDSRKLIVRQGQIAAKKLVKFEQQSLPSNLGSSLYLNWLLDLVQRHGISDSNVTPISGRSSKGVYQQFNYSLKGRATLEQTTRLLHEFYSVDRLHRVRKLTLKPGDDGELNLDMAIEVLALTSAPDTKELKSAPSDRLKHGPVNDYIKAITQRNLFGPPHRPPSITTTARSNYYIGSSVSFSVKGSDPEKRPVSYALEDQSFEGGKFDPKTGEFSWKPDEKGEYEITVRATDAGTPPKSAKQTIKFAVVDPPPEKPPEKVVAKPKFDTAKYTYLTAVIEVDGRPEAWLVVRTTGETLKLQPGEKFTAGTFKGTITEISEQDIKVETSDGEVLLISIGENLREGFMLPAGDI
jgi:hypothetical protein